MYWALGGIGVLIYIVLLIFLGVRCLSNGHWVMFLIGIFLPLFWIIGALMTPARPQAA